VFVRPQVVNPQLFCPGFFSSGFAIEEEDVGLHSLGVEDAGRKAEQGMNIGLLTADNFAAFDSFQIRVVAENRAPPRQVAPHSAREQRRWHQFAL